MVEGSDLLKPLKSADFELLEPHLEGCRFESGETFYEPGETVDHCYLPLGEAVASCFVVLDGDVSVETVMIGREGALGGILNNRNMPAYARSRVMHGGDFYRIASRDLKRVKEISPAVRGLFSRYADCLIAQTFQSIACNAVHSIEQRAAKWLSAAMDRTGNRDITMTQERLASMMGVGRSYASRVVQRLKRDGLLTTRRGGLLVLDEDRLKARACSCNDLVRKHFDSVLGGIYPD